MSSKDEIPPIEDLMSIDTDLSTAPTESPILPVNLFYGYVGVEHLFASYLAKAVTDARIFREDKFLREMKPETEVLDILREGPLTMFGKRLRSVVEGRVFVDLGCGKNALNQVPAVVARSFGASRYIGVDQEIEEGVIFKEDERGRFECAAVREDMSYVNRLTRPAEGVVFHLSGIEPLYRYSKDGLANAKKNFPGPAKIATQAASYAESLTSRLSDLSKVGDGVVIGLATFGFEPDNYGMNKVTVVDMGRSRAIKLFERV